MEIITDLNDLARDEMMNKYKESVQNRIVELQTAVDINEKKVVELTEKYMNEVNLRKNAEATAEDSTSKIEELQNALNSFQQRTCALEKEMEEYKQALKERELQSSQGSHGEELLEEGDEALQEEALQFSQSSLDEEIFEEIVDAEHEEAKRQDELREEFLKQMNRAVHEQALELSRSSLSDAILNKLEDPSNIRECEHSLSLEVLSEKLSQERQNSFFLEDRVAELEKSFHELCDLKESIVEEAENQEEWFKILLSKEREQNENLSKESDRTIEELHEKLKDAREVNSQLMKWRDEVCNSANFQEETEQKYKEIIAQYESELEEAKRGLCDIRGELLALRSEQKRNWEEEMENEIFTFTPQPEPQPLESEVSLSEEIDDEMENEIFAFTPQPEPSPLESEVSLREEIHDEMENEIYTSTPQKHKPQLLESEVSLSEEIDDEMENEIFTFTPQPEPQPLESEVSLSEEIHDEMENEIYTSTPQKHKPLPLKSGVSLSEEIREEEETPVMKYGNQKYRIKLAELIWNGMQNLLNL